MIVLQGTCMAGWLRLSGLWTCLLLIVRARPRVAPTYEAGYVSQLLLTESASLRSLKSFPLLKVIETPGADGDCGFTHRVKLWLRLLTQEASLRPALSVEDVALISLAAVETEITLRRARRVGTWEFVSDEQWLRDLRSSSLVYRLFMTRSRAFLAELETGTCDFRLMKDVRKLTATVLRLETLLEEVVSVRELSCAEIAGNFSAYLENLNRSRKFLRGLTRNEQAVAAEYLGSLFTNLQTFL